MGDYLLRHWTSAITSVGSSKDGATEITVNNRAATREAIINKVRSNGMQFFERSQWGAHKNRSEKMQDDWNYSKIAIHHAGRSFSCGVASHQLQNIQDLEMAAPKNFDDIGYHYAIDCSGNVFEGRDIRFKGENVHYYNTGVIGIVLLEDLTTAEEEGDPLSLYRQAKFRIGLGKDPVVPDDQRKAILKLVNIICEFFHIQTLGGHREFPGQLADGKICPGNVGMALVQNLRGATGLSAPTGA